MLCDKHIYILTSRYEGMPLTVLEALSCGCPCLITSQTNMEDLISATSMWLDNAFVIDINS